MSGKRKHAARSRKTYRNRMYGARRFLRGPKVTRGQYLFALRQAANEDAAQAAEEGDAA